jgi:GMP synthase (glutamine-hydrolysing)
MNKLKPMKSIVIIKAGSTFPSIKQNWGDFDDWVIAACDSSHVSFSVIDMIEGQELPNTDGLSGIIITGSHAMVTDLEPWISSLEAWISQVAKQNIPVLGICFGHQILAQALGGLVDYHPGGREIGCVPIALTTEANQDPLLSGLPQQFMAHTTHAQSVRSLPPGAQLLAENPFESHHAFRVDKHVWGVQFHPEFTSEIMRQYIDEQTPTLLNQGFDVDALQLAVSNTVEANGLLKRFIQIVDEPVN